MSFEGGLVPRLQRDLTALLLPVVGLIFGGCESTPNAPSEASASKPAPWTAHSETGQDESLRVRGTAIFQDQEFAPGFGPPDFGRSDFGGRCSAPSDFVIRFTLSGEATHLGHYTADLEHCGQVDFATALVAISDGVATFTAANGDELWDRYERVVPGGAGDPEHHRFIGGTGRFEGASGDAMALVVCDRAAGTCDLEMEGVLHYDASDRSR